MIKTGMRTNGQYFLRTTVKSDGAIRKSTRTKAHSRNLQPLIKRLSEHTPRAKAAVRKCIRRLLFSRLYSAGPACERRSKARRDIQFRLELPLTSATRPEFIPLVAFGTKQ